MDLGVDMRIGDIVVLKTGSTPMKIIRQGSYRGIIKYVCRYETGYTRVEPRDRLEYYQKEEEMKRYQTEDSDQRAGTMVGVNSQGKFVLEMDENKNMECFHKSELKEIVPYTIRFRDVVKGNFCDYVCDYQDNLKEGDLVLNKSYKLLVVVGLNTTKKGAPLLKGEKITLQPLPSQVS